MNQKDLEIAHAGNPHVYDEDEIAFEEVEEYKNDKPCVTSCCLCCNLGLGSILAAIMFLVSPILYFFFRQKDFCSDKKMTFFPTKKSSDKKNEIFSDKKKLRQKKQNFCRQKKSCDKKNIVYTTFLTRNFCGFC